MLDILSLLIHWILSSCCFVLWRELVPDESQHSQKSVCAHILLCALCIYRSIVKWWCYQEQLSISPGLCSPPSPQAAGRTEEMASVEWEDKLFCKSTDSSLSHAASAWFLLSCAQAGSALVLAREGIREGIRCREHLVPFVSLSQLSQVHRANVISLQRTDRTFCLEVRTKYCLVLFSVHLCHCPS